MDYIIERISGVYPINFYTKDHPFCEYYIYNNPDKMATNTPEYFNSFSSLFISFIGLFGLIYNNYVTEVNYLYISLIVNGLTSFMYHWTNNIGWGLMDRFSMILFPLYTFHIINKIMRKFNLRKTPHFIYKFFTTLYVTVLFTITGLHNEEFFNMTFGIYLLNLLFILLYVSFIDKKINIEPKILNIGWKGIGYIIISGIAWILTEIYCHDIWIFKYLMGHTFWHYFVSLGGYYISLIPVSIIKNKRKIRYMMKIPYLDEYESHIEYNEINYVA